MISLIIIFGAWNLIKESVNVLLEGTPAHINVAAVEETILTDGKCSRRSRSARLDDNFGNGSLERSHRSRRRSFADKTFAKQSAQNLHDEFGIDHLTIQMETPEEEQESALLLFRRELFRRGKPKFKLRIIR